MKGFRLTALAAALVIVSTGGGLLPVPVAHGQGRTQVMRAFDVGRGSRIGVTVDDLENADAKDAKAPKAGILIESVDTGGPAEKAGMKAGDAITEFDGERVRSVRQFSRLVQETPSGRTVAVSLLRDGQRVSVNVTPERSGFNDDFTYRLLETMRPTPLPPAPPEPPMATTPRAAPALPFESFRYATRGRLGVTLESLDDQLAQYFGVKDGVLVKSVAADSAAQKAGVKAGDVITTVNGRQVYEVSDVTRALDRSSSSEEFTLEVMRDRKPLTLKGKAGGSAGRGSIAF